MDPSVPAKALVMKFKDEANVSPAESRAVEIGPWSGYLVRFEDASGVEPVSLSYLWVASPRTTFIVIGLGVDEYRDQLRDAPRQPMLLEHPSDLFPIVAERSIKSDAGQIIALRSRHDRNRTAQ